MTLFWMLLGLFALIAINVPIAIALAVVAVVAMIATQGVDILPNVALVMFDGATNFPLLAIPLFIFAGAIMNTSGISRRLIA
ncbi:MAG: TRAP transporter large permease subunit, partial [Desulfobacterales bacterium]